MSTKMVTIGTFENTAEAHAAKNCLEADGIAANLIDEAVGSWLGYVGAGIGGIKLQVAPADVQRGQEILFFEKVGADGSAASWRCTRCQEIVDGGFEICWSCNGEREEFQDPSFDPLESSDDDPVLAVVNDDDVSNALLPEGAADQVDGRPNPYYAGNLPAASLAVGDFQSQTGIDQVEAMVNRAWRAAIIGIFVCPTLLLLNMYSVWLLLRISLEPVDLSPAATWKVRLTWLINLLAIFIMLTLLSLALGAWD